jgi:hypothetical protein
MVNRCFWFSSVRNDLRGPDSRARGASDHGSEGISPLRYFTKVVEMSSRVVGVPQILMACSAYEE